MVQEQNCTEHMSEVQGDAQSLLGRHLSEWPSYRVLRPTIFFAVTLVFRTDVIKSNAGYRIATDFDFITETNDQCCLKCVIFTRVLKLRVAVFKCPRHYKNVYSHNFAFTTCLIYFSHFLEILIQTDSFHSFKNREKTRICVYESAPLETICPTY